jgi:hypothetical protein
MIFEIFLNRQMRESTNTQLRVNYQQVATGIQNEVYIYINRLSPVLFGILADRGNELVY